MAFLIPRVERPRATRPEATVESIPIEGTRTATIPIIISARATTTVKSGTSFGRVKAKLGLKGKTKPGELISRMNEMKTDKTKADVKVESTIKKII